MWLVSNRTPYAAERSWIQDKDANKIWIVAVKATFDIRPDGATRLADEQLPVLRAGQPLGEPGRSSLAYEADLLWLKPGTDVLVKGSAWAERGRPTEVVDVQVRLGPVRKTLRVFGDRRWRRGIVGATMSRPVPFERMPIIYERAYGGWDRSAPDAADHRVDLRNPVGTGFVHRGDAVDGTALPNVEHPDRLIASWKDRPAPAGLNAIDCAWSPRRELAGTYDAAWRAQRFPLWAEDFDPRYGLCAPADQQVEGGLRGGEEAALVNLSPGGLLRFTVPRIHPTFQTRFGRERVEHRGRLCTVLVEPDAARLALTWQASLVCNHRVDELDMTVVGEKRVL
jgi:hypothetical protein